MNVIIILAHPQPGSFNHAIAEAAARALSDNGHDVIFHDLYNERFDPILLNDEIPDDAGLDDVIEKHCVELTNADGIVIVHPNWWGQPPAIMKGWIDRVIRPGVAYRFLENDGGEGVPEGLLKAKAAIVFNTTNTAPDRERDVFGDPLETIWRNCIFGLCGVRHFHRKTFGIIVTSSIEERRRWLDEVRDITSRVFPGKKQGGE